jgi:hypothetical protein
MVKLQANSKLTGILKVFRINVPGKMKGSFMALLCFSLFALLFTSCSSGRLKDVDVSGINMQPVQLLRLDEDIFSIQPDSFRAVSKKMNEKYHGFYTDFIFGIANRGDQRDSVFKALKLFVTDRDIMDVHKMVRQIYSSGEIKALEDGLTYSFKYFKFHFPKEEIPKQYVSFISAFNCNFTTNIDSTLGIGLDMYLGADNKYYQMMQLPKYKARFMSKEYLITDAMRAWIIHCFDKNEAQSNLLSHMIFYGKIYYALDAVLPEAEDSVKIGYTAKQMEYCMQYKKNLWAHFSEKDRLFKNDLKELAPYVSEGPFTSAIGKQCPPRIAMYMGWQIVRAYMDKNTGVTLQQLMDEKDTQKILSRSKFKP